MGSLHRSKKRSKRNKRSRVRKEIHLARKDLSSNGIPDQTDAAEQDNSNNDDIIVEIVQDLNRHENSQLANEEKMTTDSSYHSDGIEIVERTLVADCEVVEETAINYNIDNGSLMEKNRNYENDVNNVEAWSTEEEVRSIQDHELSIEYVKKTLPNVASGNRIVNLEHVLTWAMSLQVDHARICTSGHLYLWKELRDGFVSTLIFKCTMCNRHIKRCTQNESSCHNLPKKSTEKEYSVNVGAVWGTLSTGSCHSHLDELCCLMDVPPMTYRKFHLLEENLGNCWHEHLIDELQEAGQEELKLARDKGNVDEDGIPFITVYLDGGWSKRSYGHSYDAASGTAVIIGKETKKVLFLAVRNKFCYVCTVASNKQVQPKPHTCFKNWTGSSSSMESDMIVEGFKKSIEMHGLRYKFFIADGDSSVFANLKSKVDYGYMITKTECKNHVFKNYGKHLRAVKEDERVTFNKNMLSEKYLKSLVDLAKRNLYYNNLHGSIDTLIEDLENGPYHIYGSHDKCKSYYCDKENVEPNNPILINEMKKLGIFQRITGCVDTLIRKAPQIFDVETNNRAELFMSLVAKFNAGKRLNLTMKGSFDTRCKVASMQYNKGPEWYLSSWRKAIKKTPTKILKRLVNKRQRILEYRKKQPACRRKIIDKSSSKEVSNTDYGVHAKQAPLEPGFVEKEKKRILDNLQIKTIEVRDKIERDSVGQFSNFTYLQERRNRLTASYFGKIIKRRGHTPCHNDVKAILYGHDFYSEAVEYGKINERVAIDKFRREFPNEEIRESGLFVDLEHGFLGSSPDGKMGEDGLLEVKCLHSVFKSGLTLRQATEEKKTCLEVFGASMRLKRSHNYYYQIQGQLNIARRDYCYFIIYIDEKNDLFVETIKRDEHFWKTKMLPHLTTFYLENVLPEIVLRNVPNGNKCEDSQKIKEAIEARHAALTAKKS